MTIKFWLFWTILAVLLISCTNSSGSNSEHDPNVTKNQDAQIDGSQIADLVAASSFTSDVCIANRRIYVAWLDSRDGDRNIYFNARTQDRGWLHGSDLRLNLNQIGAGLDSVRICASARDGQYVHIIWADATEGQECVYYSGSSDFGQTFRTPFPLNPGWPFPYPGTVPRICCSEDGKYVFATWRYGRHDLAFRYSDDNGVSWSDTTNKDTFLVNTDTVGKFLVHYPSIDCSNDGRYCHIVWLDYRETQFFIYHRTWDMNTQTWRRIDQQVSDTRASFPTVKCNKTGDIVHIVWFDLATTTPPQPYNRGLYHDVSNDYGDTWGTDEAVPENPGDENDYGTITCDRDTGDICAIWDSNVDVASNWTVMARATKNGVWQSEVEISIPSYRLNKSGFNIPRICSVGKQIFALWTDYRKPDQEWVYYNTSSNFGIDWISQGIPLNTPGTLKSYRITSPQIACDDSGMVYGIWGEARGKNIPQIYGRYIPAPLSGDEKIPHSNLVPSHAWQSMATAYDNHIYGIWLSDRNGFQDVYLSHSGDNGFNWQNDFLINNAHGEIARYPQIASDFSNNVVYVAWEYPDYKSVNNNLQTHVYFDTYLYKNGLSQRPSHIANSINISQPQPARVECAEMFDSSILQMEEKNALRSQQVSHNQYYGGNPTMRADNNGHVYVMYQLAGTWNVNPIYMMMSPDRGIQWFGGFIPTNTYIPEYYESDYLNYDSAFSANYVYVLAEMRKNSEDSSVIIYCSNNYGKPETWSLKYLDTSSATLSRWPRIVAKDEQVFVCWIEYQISGLAQIYYVYSNDYGSTFSSPNPIENQPSTTLTAAQLATAGTKDIIYATWTAYHPDNKTKQVYFGCMQLENGIPVVSNSIPLSNIASFAENPSIVCDNNDVYVAWQDTYYGKSDIFGRHSNDKGKTWSNTYRWNTNIAGSAYAIRPELQITPQWVHCMWQDYRYSLNIFYEQRQR